MESSKPKRTLLDIQNTNVKFIFKNFIWFISRLSEEEVKQVDGWEEFIKTTKVKEYMADSLKKGYDKTYKIEDIVKEDVADLLHTCMSLLITHPNIMIDLEKQTGCPGWKWLLMHIDYRIAKKNAKVFPVMLVDNPETPKKEDPKTSNNKMDRQMAEMRRHMVYMRSHVDASSLRMKELLAELNARDPSH
jgi:hypothetical protein